jgi:transcriptional regulator with XRE-family HTH domain
MNSFASCLAALIERKGWTQIEAARQLGVSQTLISRYLSGKRVPLPRTVTHIAERLGVSAVELVGKTPTKGVAGGHKPQLTTGRALDMEEPTARSMKSLKRRWERKHADRATIRHLIEALFPEDASQIIAWLDKG